ncbi:multiprotein bridging factor aMBF1 [Methanoplanus endosymbiosus]|uniref:Multiprotein bridging factor aMBF1 n=1 Tax=Methanoplanus endosymbiosus TaxID=33865 RepID=A0A9E7PKN9_9EURY|nr:multiprotein bridging factor aMBF1 [Methanoplanus endosymbiosus]UUX91848.1 multiprotein bridging factor aMBF1 [Methanoplanus endosymbiosus]
MTECEVCGETIRGKPVLVQIGGARMRVCSKCSKLGTVLERPGAEALAKQAGKIKSIRPGASSGTSAPRRRPRDVFDMMDGDIVDDFSSRVREGREALGLSQKELALNIKEKEGLIKKIEKGMIPEDGVRKKIENALNIKLIESSDTDVRSEKSGPVTPTLGDMMKLKRSK